MPSLMHKSVWPLVAAVAIAGGSYFGTVQWNHSVARAEAPADTARPTPEPHAESIAPASDLARAFRSVHKTMEDAVVNINVVKKPGGTVRLNRQRPQIPEQFRNMLPPGFEDQLPDPDQAPEVEGTGSGVIVSADGYILTNNHVVSGANDITVTLNDGRELKADLVGTDPKTDLAVIRIKSDHLTFAKFGDSDAAEVGDIVLAFGSPFGFSQTMTQGIISAKGRHVPIIAAHDPNLRGMTYENFLQTDAAINPGNSGGPLVNLRGEVVGINSAIASNTGAYNGIGFSIPSNDAQYIMKSLISHGKVVRGFLGVMIEDVKHPLSEHKGLVESVRKEGFSGDRGILVSEVNVDGPAAKAGLQAGDVITQMNGQSVTTVDELRNQIARTAPGTKVSLNVFRDGKTQPLEVAVGTQPDTIRPTGIAAGADQSTESKDLGIAVEDLGSDDARQYGLKPGSGVVIAKVAPNSTAAEMGLKPGDVVLKLNRRPVTSAREFGQTLQNSKLSDGVRMLVRSEDGTDRVVYIEKK